MDQVLERIADDVRVMGRLLVDSKPQRLLLGREEMAELTRANEREDERVAVVNRGGVVAMTFMGLPVEAVACRRCVGFELDQRMMDRE